MKSPMIRCALALALLTLPANAQVSPSQQEARRALYGEKLNGLAFRHMDEIFDTAPVANGAKVWKLPEDISALDITYEFEGQRRTTADFLERTRTNAMLVIRDGRIVHEIYRNNSGPETRFISFSMAKSITSLLIGLAIEDGLIGSVDDPLTRYVPELVGDGYKDVTIRQALLMRSGAAFRETYGFGQKSQMEELYENSMVTGRARFADMATGIGRDHLPGEFFNYSTLETGVLGWVLERAVKRPLADYMADRLWKPAGMEAAGYWLLDGPPGVGRAWSGAGFNARLRDYGRLGLMMLNGGKANGRQVVPAAWVVQSTVPQGTEPAAPDRVQGYQFQWWTLPDSDAFMAKGVHGQFIWVDPASRTVIVKLSHWPTAWVRALENETLAYFQAVASGK
ncbi:serine hydrolase domain-containing protein [Niveispirillum sp. KHB5.9]|uniref:serine hydrolase domain-containing protein n=1 Tax=Niveispirillum sp. KHB5.9 TaxID=3400269 RepID=UPI003A871987